VWGKVPAGNPAVYYEVSLSNDPGKTFPGGWNNKNTTFRAISAAPTMGLLVYQAASTGEGRFDDVSIKPITFSTQFRLRRIYYVSYVETAIRRTSGTQKGVTLFYDINNYIKTWIGTESVYLIKCVGGVVSAVLGTGAIVYAADALLRLVPNAAFNAFSVNYGGTEVIAPVSITNFNPAGIWYAGVFNTYNGGDIAADSFENFAAVAVGA
jgi:hypothetical protein